MWIYRSQALPRAVRNWFLVAPITMPGFLIALLGGAVVLFGPPPDMNSPQAVPAALGLGGAGIFLFWVALTSVLLFRPPARMIPSWLDADNQRVGYVPPPPSLADWFYLAFFGIPAVLIGILAIGLGLT